MEKKANAQTEKETTEKTRKIQMKLILNDFSSLSLPQFCSGCAIFKDQRFSYICDFCTPRETASMVDRKPKVLVEPHFG